MRSGFRDGWSKDVWNSSWNAFSYLFLDSLLIDNFVNLFCKAV